jgi:hypothetical protein
MPKLKAIHIAKSLKIQPHETKLVNKYVLPTQQTRLRRKHENTTICIVHSTLRDATTPYMERYEQPTKRTNKTVKVDQLMEKKNN